MRILFKLFKLLFYSLLLTIVLGVPALLWLMVEEIPQVSHSDALTVEDVERAKRILRDLDLRRLKDGETRQLIVTERDANLLADRALSRWPEATNVKARTWFTPDHAQMEATLLLPDNPIGRYLNVIVKLATRESTPLLTGVQIGRLSIPGSVGRWFIESAGSYLQDRPEYYELQRAWASLANIQIEDGIATITVRYDQDLAERLQARGRDWVLPTTDRLRLGVYHEVLLTTIPTLPKRSSLVLLLKPLFARAAERTALGNDPVEENRAVLITLALYLSGKNPTRILGENYRAPPAIRPTLVGRDDLAQHFAISAALAGEADSHIANVIGVFKEVQDSQGGSGFSFADLTADRAGVRFAEQAIASATSAQDVQQRVALLDDETAIMPSIAAMPEGLQDPEFRRRFERRDSAAYNVVKDEIERRLDQCDFYRPAS